MDGAYNAIKVLYENETNEIVKEAYKSALDALPYNRFIRNGQKDYFAIDNYIPSRDSKVLLPQPSKPLG